MDISTEFVYRALFGDVFIEDKCFLNVYRECLRILRAEYGHSLYFNYGSATIIYGISQTVSSAGTVSTGWFRALKKVCKIRVSSMDSKTNVVVEKC